MSYKVFSYSVELATAHFTTNRFKETIQMFFSHPLLILIQDKTWNSLLKDMFMEPDIDVRKRNLDLM